MKRSRFRESLANELSTLEITIAAKAFFLTRRAWSKEYFCVSPMITPGVVDPPSICDL